MLQYRQETPNRSSVVQYVPYVTAQYTVVQYSTVQCSIVQYSTVQYNTQYSTKYSTVQQSTAQHSYSTVQCSTVHYNTLQCRLAHRVRYSTVPPQSSGIIYREYGIKAIRNNVDPRVQNVRTIARVYVTTIPHVFSVVLRVSSRCAMRGRRE